MAVWTQFDKNINLPDLSRKALQNDLFFSDGAENNTPTQFRNATRLGFASSTPEELEQCVEIIKKILSR
jgi:GntR family transcriptional regulator/MocR family aminotransferase